MLGIPWVLVLRFKAMLGVCVSGHLRRDFGSQPLIHIAIRYQLGRISEVPLWKHRSEVLYVYI